MPPKRTPATKPAKRTKTDVTSVRHKDKRTNIPTQELRDFVAEAEARPKTILYPRDPSLDPQLVWKGKDEQDQHPLAVPAVPIYIQEKIHPQAIIEDLRARAASGTAAPLELFSDFNGIQFEELVDFYHHEQNWSNRMILGDSLLVMTSLAEKEGLKGKVQTIYFDPPYGIKFGSNWQVSTRKKDVRDGRIDDATRQPEQVRAFRDTWRLGVHSYLAYLRDRLVAARDLLTDTGSLFVQIGDENLHVVRCLLDEVFGAENFCAMLTIAKTAGSSAELLPGIADYLLWYAKNKEHVKYRQLYTDKQDGDGDQEYRYLLMPDGNSRPMTRDERSNRKPIPAGAERFRPSATTSQRPPGSDPFTFQGRVFRPGQSQYWKTSIEGLTKLGWANRLIPRGDSISYLRKLNDFPVKPLNNLWMDTRWGFDAQDKRYVVETNAKIVTRALLFTTDPGDLVLDPTCGSGTTAFVAEQWGRRWITIDTSRVALALARTRVMAARYPYYLLADSPEGVRKEAEITGRVAPDYKTDGDIRKGFLYERVPHVTLKSIANNPDLREGLSREEIDAAIARHAEIEILYDRPYEDGRRVRVSGPFTVESLSPHRVLGTDEDRTIRDTESGEASNGPPFETTILENLKKAGVQNTFKNERLVFERIEPFAGTWIHAQGFYTDKGGTSKRVAISIGPEHGTVGPEQLKEAAKESIRGIGFDLLVVCGFAFDPHVYETARQIEPEGAPSTDGRKVAEKGAHYGRLPILLARMNPDLLNDDLLKKTGAGNLFMVFGEPEIDLKPMADGKWVVQLKGLDVYDPTTGEVRNSSTEDIACWFIDTNYNGESFFVRHAYFTGADEPYEKLKRALRAEIDEASWAALYSTISQPFDMPATGRIAIKVINHYGDEVLKIVEVVGPRH